MAKVILQPAGGMEARRHYEDTVAKNVPMEVLAKVLSPRELDELSRIHGKGGGAVWGVVDGLSRTKWGKIKPGDIALFSGQNHIYSKGIVTYKLHNPELANHLWGRDSHGKTWEYVYFLKDITPTNIPYAELNRHAGYESGYTIRGFNVLSQTKSDNVISGLGLQGYTESDFRTAIAELDKDRELDTKRETLQRTEQGFLRAYLFGGKSLASCAICGREFPIDLLRAAHIKRRADCSTEEKRDYMHNVMPTCTFGCDELFERGYMAILDGKIRCVSADDPGLSGTVRTYLDTVRGHGCSWWSAERQPYFEWHSRKHGL